MINWNIVIAVATVAGVILPIVSRWINEVKSTNRAMFKKLDEVDKDLQGYKLRVAEIYVNREALKEALAPIQEALRDIRQDLHKERRDRE